MAKTLRETLQQQLEQPAAAPQLGQTQEAQRLISAKTGKASGPSSGPLRSSMQERQTAVQARGASQQQALKGALAGQQYQQQDEQLTARKEEALKNISQDQKGLEQDFDLRAQSILNDLRRSNEKQDTAEYQSKIEQAGILTRLGNKEYIQELQIEATKNRLNNDVKLKEELALKAWDDEKGLFQNDIAFKSLINSNRRQFNEALKIMDANTALKLAESDVEAFKTRQIWAGVGQLGSAGAMAYGQGMFDSSPTPGQQVTNAQANQQSIMGNTQGGVLA